MCKKKRKKTHISLRIDLHFRHDIVVLHVLFTDVATVLHDLDAFPEIVCRDGAGFDGGFGDECYGCLWDESLCRWFCNQ